MVDDYYISTIIEDFFFVLIISLTFVYSSLILFIRRFRHRNNIFILNICLTIMSTSIYFIIYFTMLYFNVRLLYAPNMCIILLYTYNIASIAIPYSFVIFSVHRFCSIVYPAKPFFKTKRWVGICIASQWVGECIISLPFILRQGSFCNNEAWMRIYTFIMSLFVPLFINIVLNFCIFIHVRSSTRRVQPQITNTITNENNNRQTILTGRDISLLRQIVFMFCTFVIGWTPVYLVVILTQYIYLNPLIFRYCVVVGDLALIAIIINLFLYNHQLREYLINIARQYFRY